MTVIEIVDANGIKQKIDVQTSGEGVEQLVADLAVKSLLEGSVKVNDGGGTLSVDDGSGSLTIDGTVTLGAGSAAIGKLAANAGINIGSIGAQTTGGAEFKTLISVASTNATIFKASAGQVYGYYLYNAGTTPSFVKLYNKATAPSLAVDVPAKIFALPPESAANMCSDIGVAFGSGISVAIVNGMANTNTTAVGEEEVLVNLDIK